MFTSCLVTHLKGKIASCTLNTSSAGSRSKSLLRAWEMIPSISPSLDRIFFTPKISILPTRLLPPAGRSWTTMSIDSWASCNLKAGPVISTYPSLAKNFREFSVSPPRIRSTLNSSRLFEAGISSRRGLSGDIEAAEPISAARSNVPIWYWRSRRGTNGAANTDLCISLLKLVFCFAVARIPRFWQWLP